MRFKFSVIIPTYNRAFRLSRALRSLVDQSYDGEFEVVVCDDGSTDNTKEVVDGFRDKLALKYVELENWGGPARPRNEGIVHAEGEFLCFLDSDDWFYKEKLKSLVSIVNDYDFIFHDLDVYSDDQVSGIKVGRVLTTPIFEDLVSFPNPISTSGSVVRTNVMRQVMFLEDKALAGVEDFDAWLRLSLLTNKFFYYSVILGAYEVDHGSNISAHLPMQIERKISIFEKFVVNLDESKSILALNNFHLHIATFYCKAADYDSAFSRLRLVLSDGNVAQKSKAFCYYVYIFCVKLYRKY